MKHIMICQILFVCLLISVDARSLQKVSDKNVTKRAANGEFYPDWVPFKNKPGEELGEFVQVESKKKPKKRLALPVNFKLKAVAAPDSEYDDFGAGQGEDGGEDFEKKEWSDLYRPAIDSDPVKLLNHTDISDIDGVVNIITKPKPSIVRLLNVNKKSEEPFTIQQPEVTTKTDDYDTDQTKDTEAPKQIEKGSKEEKAEKEEKEAREEQEEREDKDNKNNEESKHSGENDKPQNDDDYEDDQKTKEKAEQTEKERKESEARKALILDAVDELKARHQAEQRILSEKVKEEEIFKEEHERDKIDSEEGRDKYERKKPKVDHYDDYEDSVSSSTYDKYKINVETTTVQTTTTTTLRPTPRRPKKHKKRTKLKSTKPTDSGKLSVFKNPGAYMIKEEESTSSTTTTTTARPRRRETTRFSSRYAISPTTPRNRDESLRIELVPETSDSEGSPTLFFPQTKNKRKKKRGKGKGKGANRVSTPSPDSYVAETIEEKKTKNLTEGISSSYKIPGFSARSVATTDKTAFDVYTVADTTGSDSKLVDTNTGPSGQDGIAINSDSVSDVVAASTDKKEAKKGGNYEHKRGGGRQYSSAHDEVHEEHGKKAYEGKHEDERQAKGHHDKEDHSGEYVDRAGTNKEHHDESNHYGHHHHEEHGKKHAKYEESGKHAKGHSTKGSHDIHKKEEYEKRVEFFEEDGDSSEEEKHGGFNHEREHSSGGHFKKGKLEAGHHHLDKGDSGNHLKGGHAHGVKGHKQSGGHDGHGRHHDAHFHKQGHQAGKKWAHSHTSPGKVANLVAVDRRVDQYYNGPQYYG